MTLNPGVKKERLAELASFYGGATSAGYLHNVLGIHGAPEYGVFDMRKYLACCASQNGALIDPDGPWIDYDRLIVGDGPVIVGVDVGFARDPTEVVVYDTRDGVMTAVARMTLHHVDYAVQEARIAAVLNGTGCTVVGIDVGGAGAALFQSLSDRMASAGPSIIPVNFGSSVSLVTKNEWGMAATVPVKHMATLLIQRAMADVE